MSSFIVLFTVSLFVDNIHLIYSQQTCGPKVSPRLLMSIPCDMSRSSYCSLPGTSYPWNSVRRYIFENQGLMKRMYGDQRHSMILRNEIDDIKSKYDSVYLYGLKINHGDRRHYGPRAAFYDDFDDAEEAPPSDSPQEASSSSPEVLISSAASPSVVSTATSASTGSSTGSLPATLHHSSSLANFSEIVFQKGEETTVKTEFEAKEAETYAANVEDLEVTTANVKEDASSEAKTTTPSSSTSPPPPPPPAPSAYSSATETPEAHNEADSIPKKGVNACPVKEEVIAPYWANNTRGEVLALLNVYPFEQYVHWEKCAYENAQMFCREGCRCEQQYRLHRLLAFDPKNECRGIFADWFRFPSCCVCICYDLPEYSVFYRINRRKSRL